MMDISFDYTSSKVSNNDLEIVRKILEPEIKNILASRTTQYSNDYASINLPFDNKLAEDITATVKEKKSYNPTTLVVIGIGGSNLGTQAIVQALWGKFYNEKHRTNVYFVDTVDTDHINDIIEFVEKELITGHTIIINVISKSGTTTETIANFELFLEILKNYRPYNYHDFVVVTTDKNSVLWQLAQQEKFSCLIIPKYVGGRYSVLSAVGLFPLCFLGIDIKELQAGAQSGCIASTENDFYKNSAALSAAILAIQYRQGYVIHDTFLFSVSLEGLGLWYRQLVAESLGKKNDRNNQIIHAGITPTVSIGSTDLHSVVQLYLAGPYNRFTTFVEVTKNKSDLKVPNYKEFETLVPHIQNKLIASIMNAILSGTKKAYHADNRPFISTIIHEKSAYYIGQWIQIKMIEVMYLGFLLNVNPFDQPQVESYKKETRHILVMSKK